MSKHGTGGIIKGGLELHCLETNYDHQEAWTANG
jgi:hypothetical protein